MPSTSAKQQRFMAAVAHSPSFAKKAGVSQSVGKDFNAADKGKTFNKGGNVMESKKMVGREMAFMKKKGAPASMIKNNKAEMGMKAGGKVKRYDDGGNISKEDVAAFGMPTAQKIQELHAENKGYLEGQDKYPAEARLQKDLALPARIARRTGVYLKEKYGDVKGNVKGMFGNREALRELRGRQLSRENALGYKKGGGTTKMVRGGGIESRGKTKGRFI